MADTAREREATEELSDLLCARGFNAGAPDATGCSKLQLLDSPKLIPCETLNEQDMTTMRSCIAAADSIGMKTLQHIVQSLETRLQSALMQAVMQILETLGKDAAVRVNMAERKASVMEQELINSKQQALAMMLRIKHSSDSMLVDAERRLLLEKRLSQELEYKVGSLQETVRKMKLELKRKGDVLEELQRAQLDTVNRSGLMSPSEGVPKKRKGHPQVRLLEVETSQPGIGLVEDECDDTATLLATMNNRSPMTDRPNSVLGRGLIPSTPQVSAANDCSRAAPTNYKPGSLRRHLDDGNAVEFPSRRDKELNSSAGCAAEQTVVLAESKNTNAKPADVEEESSDQNDSSGPPRNAETNPHRIHDSLVNGEDMEGMDDGFLGLIALQGASPNPSTAHELQNGDGVPELKSGAEANNEDVSDSSTDDEEEYQSKQSQAARSVHRNSDEGTLRRSKVPDTSKSSVVEQTMVLRRSSAGRRRGKKHVSPEKTEDPVAKEIDQAPGDVENAEIGALAKLKAGAPDTVDGSNSLVVESSRDSRRLMQGARQLLSLRKL